jgi:protease IV
VRKKHPILFGFFLLLIMSTGFFLVVYGMSSVSGEKHSFAMNDRIGVVTVEGFIGDSSEVVEQLNEFDKDESVKAIIIRIDSPGGGVAPSQEIYEAIVKAKKNKKVVSSMGSVAASGGYMIACATDKIVANPGTITGSISAVMHFADAEELLKKIGLKTTVVKSGKYKDIGSPARAMTAEEKALIQELVDDIFDQFLETVSQNRKISKEDLRKIADGRVFSGRQAKKLGLVDYTGDMSYAIDLAGKMSGIQGKPDIIYPRKKGPKLWEYLLGDMLSAIEGKIKTNTQKLNGIHYMFMPLMNYPEELLSR